MQKGILSIREEPTVLHEEVEKRYLAYALSTIVSRALPDVRDGLKPVHRRILYAMYGMRLADNARMRKSAAVVGEVIGKYHPHGDQAAYDALVRMAQDFSLRYPLIEGSGNFGSLDGDAPAAMRYTETRLSAFAGLLLKEIEQGTTEFRPTYDGMGDEPLVLPAMIPNLLLNGSSGIAVGMSCSFPPHNLREVINACRAAIQSPQISNTELLDYIKGPDFPTGAEILEPVEHISEVYGSGNGSVRVRGTYTVEQAGRGKRNLIVTSIPYTVNKSRLIERIAQLIRDKKLKQVIDIRDESTSDVRIVLELKSGETNTDAVMAFVFKHTDLQINFPMNFIAITPQGVPDRLSLAKIIRFFLDFRYETTVMRLNFRLANLRSRIHILRGFEIIFIDLDKALAIIRHAKNRDEAQNGLKNEFGLDDEQVTSILEMRLYRLVGLEIGKLVEELNAKRKEASGIEKDLADSKRIWKIIDKEFAEISEKFGDDRKTQIVHGEAPASDYDPEQFLDHEDVTVIFSIQGWIRRIKAEIDDETSLKFRDDDGLLTWVRVNTSRPIGILTNIGKVYVLRAIDIPSSSGFGEPLSKLVGSVDGECVITVIAPDPAIPEQHDEQGSETNEAKEAQTGLFEPADLESPHGPVIPFRAILVTKKGYGFRFDYSLLREPSKRSGRRLVNLKTDDEVLAIKPELSQQVVLITSNGNVLSFPIDQVPVLAGPGQGVRLIKMLPEAEVKSLYFVNNDDVIVIQTKRNRTIELPVSEITISNRDTKGKNVAKGVREAVKAHRDRKMGVED